MIDLPFIENGARNEGVVEFDEGAVAFLDFNDAILNCHGDSL